MIMITVKSFRSLYKWLQSFSQLYSILTKPINSSFKVRLGEMSKKFGPMFKF